jgi:SAM-dependent methyltransferase
MPVPFTNIYDDDARATAYARLEFPGTYHLAFRDIPAMLERHVRGSTALDFGCGAGRSSRFLKRLGFDVLGVDIAATMLGEARVRDPEGSYLLVSGNEWEALQGRRFDLVFSAFTFDNIPDREARRELVQRLANCLSPAGCFVNLVSSPDIYLHEWLSFSTKAFPENRRAQSGDVVRIVMRDMPELGTVIDVLWTDADYRELYDAAGLQIAEVHRPLGRKEDPYAWVSETAVAPWTIYMLARATR